MTDTSTPLEAEPIPSASPARAFQSDALKRLLEAAAAREHQDPAPTGATEFESPALLESDSAPYRPDEAAARQRTPVPLALSIAFVAFVSAVAIWLLLFSN